jgi:ankyrin repeat protein
MTATTIGYYDIVDYLFENGADLNIKNNVGIYER